MSEPSDAFKRRVDAELAPIRNHLDELAAWLRGGGTITGPSRSHAYTWNVLTGHLEPMRSNG